jgi:class 3 adenylate cyclase/tetratricopeptide (TPR) repeat protein
MQDKDTEALRTAIAALESQRATLGDAVLELATAPLRARLAALLRPAGLKHRLVTVLFADVVGSTAMANGMEAEDTLGLLSAVLRRMAALIEAHQGRVLRFTGDGVKAAFGMDETREDDAERAVRVGLAILAAVREQAEAAARLHGITDFAVRVGVHSGDVALGAGVEDDNTAMGAAVNIAARMEQHAPPGGLRISHDTWSQVRGLFELEAQPPLQVKGIEAPMQTYLVRAALERGVAGIERGLQGLATPMVGRDAELQRLLQTVARTRETRQLQALTLIGDAGLGKSRLLRELIAALQDCRVMVLRSQPDSQLRPWGLLRSLLALQCGVADTDSADVAKRKVVEGLSPWFEERGERQAQLIGQLSGLDFADSPTVKGLDPPTLRDQALTALRAYLQALAAQGNNLPVLVVEDLHWADDSSLDLVQHLQAHSAELPLALVMTARPPLLVRRLDWVKPDAADTTDAPVGLMTLSPLPAAQSDELVQALLQRLDEVPPRLSELIVGRAEGNPYYMEELVRRLIDDGVIDATGPQWTVRLDRLDTLRLPTTLVGLLQARLDALPAGERQAARQASVIGHVFWDDALQSLDAQAPQALPALQRAAFVKARDSSDFEGTAERQFDHHLLHQVTYDTLLKAERKLGHGAAARWLQARTQGRGAEFLAMTGEHAERAGETALAIDCFEQAAKEAVKRYANTAAVTWLRNALSLLGDSDLARRWELLYEIEDIASNMGDAPAHDAVHEEMDRLLERHPADDRQAQLWVLQAMLAGRRGDTTVSERLLSQAVERATRCGAAMWAAIGYGNLAWLRYARQDYLGARDLMDVAMRWVSQVEPEDMRLVMENRLLLVSAFVAQGLCRFDEARTAFRSALAHGEALGKPITQLGALQGLTTTDADLCLWESSAAWATRMYDLAHTIGSVPRMAGALWHLAYAEESMGRHAESIPMYEKVVAFCRSFGDRRKEAIALQRLGVVHRTLGRATDACQYLSQSQALHQTIDDALEACNTTGHVAWCELDLGRHDAALSTVNGLLERLATESRPAHETIQPRWACQHVLQVLGDTRAAPMLEQLFADVQVSAAEMTDAADRERLIQASPVYSDIVAAYGRRDAEA